jgi:hypothetical protein
VPATGPVPGRPVARQQEEALCARHGHAVQDGPLPGASVRRRQCLLLALSLAALSPVSKKKHYAPGMATLFKMGANMVRQENDSWLDDRGLWHPGQAPAPSRTSLSPRIAHTCQGGWGGPAAARRVSARPVFFMPAGPFPGGFGEEAAVPATGPVPGLPGCWRRLCTVLCELRKTHPLRRRGCRCAAVEHILLAIL